MRLSTDYAVWPENVALKFSSQKKIENSEELKLTFINHASFLIQKKGINILTDPIFSNRASPVSFAGPKRVIPPGVKKEHLPKIDLILISHDHYDHLDRATLELLIKRDNPQILVGLGIAEIIGKESKVKEMKWWDSHTIKGVTAYFTPAQHFSGRGLFNRNSTLWGSFTLVFSDDYQIHFGGDTGYSKHFKDIERRLGKMDLAILPIGAYAPRSFMQFQHMDPDEATQAFIDLRADYAIGMHWGTFQLTAEAREEPKNRILAYHNRPPFDRFLVMENGECLRLFQKKLKQCEEKEK
jgi:L-ascorbate metabolism protein UlaG (beta-lactamase superfamily)